MDYQIGQVVEVRHRTGLPDRIPVRIISTLLDVCLGQPGMLWNGEWIDLHDQVPISFSSRTHEITPVEDVAEPPKAFQD